MGEDLAVVEFPGLENRKEQVLDRVEGLLRHHEKNSRFGEPCLDDAKKREDPKQGVAGSGSSQDFTESWIEEHRRLFAVSQGGTDSGGKPAPTVFKQRSERSLSVYSGQD